MIQNTFTYFKIYIPRKSEYVKVSLEVETALIIDGFTRYRFFLKNIAGSCYFKSFNVQSCSLRSFGVQPMLGHVNIYKYANV